MAFLASQYHDRLTPVDWLEVKHSLGIAFEPYSFKPSGSHSSHALDKAFAILLYTPGKY